MSWETIKRCGYWHEESYLEDGPGVRKATDLLRGIVKVFAKEASLFYWNVEELPFIDRERQIHSVMLPAIAKTSTAVFMEHPINRKYRGFDPSHGWIDYWILHRDAVFLMELKHSWFSLRTKELTEGSRKRWKNAVEQIKSIPIDEARELAHETSEIFLIAMIVMPFWEGSSNKTKLELLEKEETLQLFSEEIMAKLRPKPNWGAIWSLHENLQEPQKLTNKWYEHYPAVSMLSFIDQVQ
jgi:hypothetical protein